MTEDCFFCRVCLISIADNATKLKYALKPIYTLDQSWMNRIMLSIYCIFPWMSF
uniref:Uncharacterized protein n=1 Tax=Lotus japonicus TaxID=34305 RepID=I3SYQ2_LOTJA|nr:unknown [Lotus japonicus]